MDKLKRVTHLSNNFERIKGIKSILRFGGVSELSQIDISIVIPTYNRIELLIQAIESAALQVDADLEYEIIVLDNSLENYPIVIDELIKRGINLRRFSYYTNTKNLGMFGNWNRGIELARGKWIAFLHDDDLLRKDYLVLVKKIIENTKAAAIIASNDKITNTDTVEYDRLIEKKTFLKMRQIDSLIWGTNPYGAPTCGSLFLKSKAIESGGFDDRLFPSSDWFFLYSMNESSEVLKSMFPLGYYRQLDNESLKKSTIISFVEDIVVFQTYASQSTFIGRIANLFFGEEQYVDFVNRVIQMSSGEVRLDDINNIKEYRVRNGRLLLFKVTRIVYWKVKYLFSGGLK